MDQGESKTVCEDGKRARKEEEGRERKRIKIKADEVLMEKEEGAEKEKERMKGRKGGGNAEI